MTTARDLDARVRQFSPATAHSQPVRDLFNNVPAAVTALCAVVEGVPRGLVATSLSVGVSFEPPMVAFSLSEASSSAEALMRCDTLVVHFARRKDMQLARLCATSGAVRFGAGVAWARWDAQEG